MNTRLRRIGRIVLIVWIPAALATGCAIRNAIPVNCGKVRGRVWGTDRYLHVDGFPTPGDMKGRAFRLANEGYVYSLAAALALQMGEEDAAEFELFQPSSLELVDRLDRTAKGSGQGFQAATFVYSPPDRRPDGSNRKVIVAFSGTNEFWKDWFLQNLSFWPVQYDDAREYMKDVRSHFGDGVTVIVTGYSLGGGLASHVLRHEETQAMVEEAWLFNSSPRDGYWTRKNDRVRSLWADTEVLADLRPLFFEQKMGAPGDQHAKYGLVDASSAWLHARWVLARQLLWFADAYQFELGGRDESLETEPLRIIEKSRVPSSDE